MNSKWQLIAGPCSAETREQVMETAKGLVSLQPSYFRAGIWKPRTRPGEFEGSGNPALEWMKEAKATYGLKICTEVANANHVELALNAGFDMLWIGARTTTNPFSVQEIADALRGVDMPIMVKNPINPDLKLWVGAIERLYNVGVVNVSAIHRGFSVYEIAKYRNNPNWQIPIDLKQELPQLPLLCDPSHITGDASMLLEVAQKAIDLKYDGLMLETHCNPREAWTDAKQQVSPAELAELLAKLHFRDRREIEEAELLEFRAKINAMDEAIIHLLTERMFTSGLIGKFKKEHNLAILQKARWEELLMSNVDKAVKLKLSNEFSTQLFKLIHQESIHIQSQILNDKNHE